MSEAEELRAHKLGVQSRGCLGLSNTTAVESSHTMRVTTPNSQTLVCAPLSA